MKLTLSTVKDVAARVMNVVRLGTPKATRGVIRGLTTVSLKFDRPGFLDWAIVNFGTVDYNDFQTLQSLGTQTVIPESGEVEIDIPDNLEPGNYTFFFATTDVDGRNESVVWEYDLIIEELVGP